jgi:hypothetical protein
MLRPDNSGGKWVKWSRDDGREREGQRDDEEKGVEMMAV